MSQRESWDFGRFLQTIAYFDGIPFLDCLPWLRNKLLKMDSPPITPNVGDRLPILAIALNDNVTKSLVEGLGQDNYSLRVLVADLSYAKSLYPDRGIILSDRVTPDLLTGVRAIVGCGDIPESDRRWGEMLQTLFTTVTETESLQTKTLFDFSQPSEDVGGSWGAVDDVVMGGVSKSNIYRSNDCAIFSGTVSTANSGGFASVRHRNFQPPLNLSPYEGIQLQVKGDGKRYNFIARCEGNWDGVSYCYSFDTVADQWVSIRIPFSQLIPVFRAKTLTDVGVFEKSRTYSLQLMFSKFEYDRALNPTFTPGSFSLQIKEIAAYGGNLPQLIWIGTQPPENSSLSVTSIDPIQFAGDDKGKLIEQFIKI